MKLCWNLTNLCNEECIYCFRELKEGALGLEDNLNILKKLYSIGVETITFAGGEPLLYKGIEELMHECKKLGITVNLITNGKALKESNLKQYLSDVSKLTFSIDSPNTYVNESSGRGMYHYEHIKKLLPSINELFPNIILEVNTVVTKENSDEIDFMFEALGSEMSFYGLKKWKISRFCPLRGYAKERKNFLNLPDEVFESIKHKYTGMNSFFEIQVRDLDAVEENIILSPSGGLKKAVNCEDVVLVSDVKSTSSYKIRKLINNNGGCHV